MPQTRGDTKSDKPSECAMEDLINKVCSTFVSKLTSKINDVEAKMGQMNKHLNEKLSKLDKLDDINAELIRLNDSFSSLSNTVSSNTNEIKELDMKLNLFERSIKSNSLRIYGLNETTGENISELVSAFISENLLIPCSATDINCAFRMGKKISNSARPRPILVSFVNNWKRSDVYGARRRLKMLNLNVSIFEDLTKERYNALKSVKEKYGRDKVWTSGGRIYFLKDGNKTLYES